MGARTSAADVTLSPCATDVYSSIGRRSTWLHEFGQAPGGRLAQLTPRKVISVIQWGDGGAEEVATADLGVNMEASGEYLRFLAPTPLREDTEVDLATTCRT